jgi:hypothetical protein
VQTVEVHCTKCSAGRDGSKLTHNSKEPGLSTCQIIWQNVQSTGRTGDKTLIQASTETPHLTTTQQATHTELPTVPMSSTT